MNKALKIMIADDDAGIVDSISMILEFAGYDVSSTMNGATLLKMESLPDLLLLDIWMSGVDGRDICRALKKNEATSKLPIVMISASKDIEASAKDAGANDFLPKPFDMDELIQCIERNMRASKEN
jgi:DNA-binding response OmpR family regulator